jgi:hypothetical protein
MENHIYGLLSREIKLFKQNKHVCNQKQWTTLQKYASKQGYLLLLMTTKCEALFEFHLLEIHTLYIFITVAWFMQISSPYMLCEMCVPLLLLRKLRTVISATSYYF